LTSDGKVRYSGTTQEHFLMGTGSILVGRNTATYRVWDAMRSLDYLQSRPDVDPVRIGMTGCSGGGTLTSYVMALDDRVSCAAPACYLTTFRRLIDTIGPQDAEQNIFGQIRFGLDHPDYVILRAPKPTLISSTSRDFFDIQGSWETLRQSKRLYARLGAAERVDLVEADGEHGVQPANLAAISQWFGRWLVKNDAPSILTDFSQYETLPESDLLCTENGQVLRLAGEKSVYQLNAEYAQTLVQRRQDGWNKLDRDQRMALVGKTAGIRSPTDIPKTTSTRAGKVVREKYHIDKLVMHPDSGVPLPALTFHPKDPSEAAYLYVHDGGKEADGAIGGPIEKLVERDFVVVSIDLRGQGETASGKPDAMLGDWKTFYLAYLMGQSVVGAHAEDILAAAQWVADYQSEKPREIHLVAVGKTCVAALHAAAMNPHRFTSITLKDGPGSWSSMLGNPEASRSLTTSVHGALFYYDLDELRQCAGEEKILRE
jgi:cephalosporin-C deacetylase-like acetyl esterase